MELEPERFGAPAGGVAGAEQAGAGLSRLAAGGEDLGLERVGVVVVEEEGVIGRWDGVIEDLHQGPACVGEVDRACGETSDRIADALALGKRHRVAAPDLSRRVVDELRRRIVAEGLGEGREPRDEQALAAHEHVAFPADVDGALLWLALDLGEQALDEPLAHGERTLERRRYTDGLQRHGASMMTPQSV